MLINWVLIYFVFFFVIGVGVFCGDINFCCCVDFKFVCWLFFEDWDVFNVIVCGCLIFFKLMGNLFYYY